MSYEHSSVYIVRVVDIIDGEPNTWFVGPYGCTRAEQVAAEFSSKGSDCYVEALFSDDECLRVSDYDRATHRSLR